ncbi:HlyD family efflux transporter periplasmic adaptor subunit [Thermosynechococcus sp. B0]|uniref:HlyD family secretion protein n=1 Tax=unclassified Thermosynechococcus TaxID=2622553 RepID=UPI0025784E97|nr:MULTISPECIES: HlyD family efflux transporter periplasmic adaptor subunit [unclassified Thermosynechococcus]WJI23072.1 HlyD family efflux transporter periplasmic adaptor subunit [Thermosynechococcus sp. B0]WJI25587.1 HlyD family efflux transporter periplasmic adaptor subunit [Thermosynechococcus sp. B1]WJI28119.1 HlyD family efflux transporter periplasmic adaptor subunit [Thermosynechococcus sp. B3]
MNTSSSSRAVATKPPQTEKRRRIFRIVRIGLGVTLIGLAVYVLWWRQRNVVSRVGYLNGTIITLYARIPGTLTLRALRPGELLSAGTEIGTIRNDRNPQLETDRQNLETRLNVALSQQRGLQQKRNSRMALISQLDRYQQSQQTLEVRFAQEAVQRTLGELRQAQEALAIARIEADRYTSLVETGAVARQLADEAVSRAKQAAKFVESKQAELRRQQTALQAARQGLQLDASRTFSFPQIRLIDLETELVDIDVELLAVATTIAELRREIANIKQQLSLQRLAPVKVPTTAVVWSVIHKTGDLGIPLTAGDPIVKILDCSDVWATGLVAERDNPRLRVGQEATVRLLDGSDRRLTGIVRAIRGGPGKVEVGENVAVPPPDLVRNELAVDVQLNNLPEDLSAERFCGVGQSVEVIFGS